MVAMKAVALYDFQGNRNADEMSFQLGDIITVTSRESSDGWWEGIGPDGETGVFPELYVQLLDIQGGSPVTDSRPPTPRSLYQPSIAMPAPPSKAPTASPAIQSETVPVPPPLPFHLQAPKPPLHPPPVATMPTVVEEEVLSPLTAAPFTFTRNTYVDLSKQRKVEDDTQTVMTMATERRSTWSHSNAGSQFSQNPRRRQTLRKSLNRFSTFVSSGAESFLLRKQTAPEVHTLGEGIPLTTDGHYGTSSSTAAAFEVSIEGWKKQSKFAGTQTLISFQVKSQQQQQSFFVLRRTKHFEWLHEQLAQKFTALCLPPLVVPDGQAQGRFAPQDPQERKRRAYERYLRRLARHPVVGSSEIMKFFLTCSDDAQWKLSRRQLEKDPLKGSAFLQTLTLRPSAASPTTEYARDGEDVVPEFSRVMKHMGIRVDALVEAGNAMLHATPGFQHVFLRLSVMLRRLVRNGQQQSPSSQLNSQSNGTSSSSWCWKKNCAPCAHLSTSIEETSDVMREVADYYALLATQTTEPFVEQLIEYQQLVPTSELAIILHQSTHQRLRSVRRMAVEQQMEPEWAETVQGRCDVLMNLSEAEMNRMHEERNQDFKRIMLNWLDGQLAFHKRLIERLEAAKVVYQEE